MRNLLSLLFLFCSFILMAQDDTDLEKNMTISDASSLDLTQNNIYLRVESLKKKSFEEVVTELTQINLDIHKFIQNEKEACSKLHATQLISKNKLEKEKKRPLTKKEKEYCKLLIVNFQIKLNELIHEIRVEKLKEEHLGQLAKVQDEYQARITQLEKAANKLK